MKLTNETAVQTQLAAADLVRRPAADVDQRGDQHTRSEQVPASTMPTFCASLKSLHDLLRAASISLLLYELVLYAAQQCPFASGIRRSRIVISTSPRIDYHAVFLPAVPESRASPAELSFDGPNTRQWSRESEGKQHVQSAVITLRVKAIEIALRPSYRIYVLLDGEPLAAPRSLSLAEAQVLQSLARQYSVLWSAMPEAAALPSGRSGLDAGSWALPDQPEVAGEQQRMLGVALFNVLLRDVWGEHHRAAGAGWCAHAGDRQRPARDSGSALGAAAAAEPGLSGGRSALRSCAAPAVAGRARHRAGSAAGTAPARVVHGLRSRSGRAGAA